MRSQDQDSAGYRSVSAYRVVPGNFPQFSCVKMAAGQFNVWFNKPFKSIPSVVVTPTNTTGYGANVAYADQYRALVYTFTSNAGIGAGFTDIGFSLTAIGVA
jgi:hypothetical protein